MQLDCTILQMINYYNTRHVVRSLANLERYTCAAVDWPTPILPDENIEYWWQRYELYGLRERGVRFILFLQSPLYWLRRC